MRKIFTTVLLSVVAILSASAELPELFLRGEISGWDCKNEFKFQYADGAYSLHLDQLYGQFKIADRTWDDNTTFGAATGGNGAVAVSAGQAYQILRPGFNFGCNGTLTDVTLKFEYAEGQSNFILQVLGEGGEIIDNRLSGTLPVLYINVYTDESHQAFNNEIISRNLNHKNYFSYAEYWLDLNGCEWMAQEGAKSVGSQAEPLPLEIKARGNWTRIGFSKKPFKLKLGSKEKLLGMTKSKHFALLAHADDHLGYLKNFVGFNLGKRIGLPWTPAQQPVEVVINGDYRGLYFLTESIRIDKDRVNITELDDNCSDPALASGGYLVELDNYDEDNQIRLEEKTCVDNQRLDMVRVTWDTPEEYSELQKRFVTDQFTAINNAVGANSDDLWRYLDLDDAARYYLVEEIISHTESYHGSTYLFRDRGYDEKWHFSPLWDCGNAFSGPENDFFYNHDAFGNTWIPSIRTNNKFNDKVKATWLWFMNNGYNGIYDDINTYVGHIATAANYDYQRWHAEPAPDGGQPVADNRDMNSRKSSVINKLIGQTNWLKGIFGDYAANPGATEPARDTTPAAPLPDYLSGIENVEARHDSTLYPTEYYDLTGRRVLNPAAGSIVIERHGPSARKIRF
ncbi:MAG: CotH kinase family protein [Muribaculaceae bacterium]|nr:CotH kinase family protein [Muribaculaceae bacterium]